LALVQVAARVCECTAGGLGLRQLYRMSRVIFKNAPMETTAVCSAVFPNCSFWAELAARVALQLPVLQIVQGGCQGRQMLRR